MPPILTRRTLVHSGVATAAALPLGGTRAWAQAWPSKPIKIVNALPAGSLTDLLSRAYGEYLAAKLGQPVVVENKPGAGGSLAALAVKASPADGNTLLFALGGTFGTNRVIYKNLAYDPDKDFVLISIMLPGSLVFAAHKSTGASNVKEFVEYARKHKTNVGTLGAGTAPHIVVAELNKQFGLQMEAVHYGRSMWQDFDAGVIQAAQGVYYNTINSAATGSGRVIAVWPRRSSKLPDVPTFAEQGVSSRLFGLSATTCLAGPSGMPKDIVERLSTLMVEAGKSERVQKMLDTQGIDEAATGHVEANAWFEKEKPVWIELVTSLGLTPE